MSIRVVSPVLFACALGLLAAGCSTRADMDQVQNGQFELRGMVANNQQQIAALQDQVHRLGDEIDELKHGGVGDTALQDLNQRVAKLESEMNAQASAAGPGASMPSSAPSPASGTPPLPATASASPPPAAPSAPLLWKADLDKALASASTISAEGARQYRAGLGAMNQGNYPLAVAKFSEIQRKYPKSELTVPAEYFSANALFELGKYDQAILRFNDLVMRDPAGTLASPSLLREAQAFLKLNDRIDARLTLRKLLADHPNSPEAATAQTMMKELESS